jgi:hypothetical protein
MDKKEKKTFKTVSQVIRAKIFIWSLLITPVALVIGFVSTGAGHGDYVLARILFPYAFAYWFFSSDAIPGSLIILGLLQIPIYGVLLALPSNKYITAFIGMIIVTLHSTAVYLCFLQNIP